MKHSETLKAFSLFITLFLYLNSDAQNETANIKSDTTFVLTPSRFCETLSDTSIYKNEKYYPEDNFYKVYKLNGSYYLEKITYHNDYASADGNGHSHEYKVVQLDSFPPLDQPWIDITIIKKTEIKPFAYNFIDSNGIKSKQEMSSLHDCILKMIFTFNDEEISIEVPTFPLEELRIIDNPERNIHYTYENINYLYNQNLNSVRCIRYIQDLIQRLQKERKFILLH